MARLSLATVYEIKKIKAVFQILAHNWERADIWVQARYFGDNHGKENLLVDSLAADFLFGNSFKDFPWFVGCINCRWFIFKLMVVEDNSGIHATITITLHGSMIHSNEPFLVKTIPLSQVREAVWKAYYIIQNNPQHMDFKKLKGLF